MSQVAKQRQEIRQADFKRGIDSDDARRNRDESLISIRKNKREDKLAKKRQQEPSISQMVYGTSQDMPTMINKLFANTFEDVLTAASYFRGLLSLKKDPPIQNLIDAKLVPRFVNLCTASQYPKLQYEAVWIITNIASGTSLQTKTVVDQGIIPILIQLLRSADENLREQAMWALGNISGDSPSNRDNVLKSGVIELIILNLQHTTKLSMVRKCTWVLNNLSRGKPRSEFSLIAPALPILAKIILCNDDETLTDAAWALSYISEGGTERVVSVVQAGVLNRLTQLLNHPLTSIQTAALRTIGNVASSNDYKMTDAIVNIGVVPILVSFIKSPHKSIRKETLWTLSNIAAGTENQIQAIIDANSIPEVIYQMNNGEWEIKKEATWIICNLLSGATAKQICKVIDNNVIKSLLDMIICEDQQLILLILGGLKNILSKNKLYINEFEDLGGLDLLEKLQEHSNKKIYEKAVEIIEKYFSVENISVEKSDYFQFDNQFTSNTNRFNF